MARNTSSIGGRYLARSRSSSPEDNPMSTSPTKALPRPTLPSFRDFFMTSHPNFSEDSLLRRPEANASLN